MDYPDEEVTKVHKQNTVWSIILCFWALLFVFTAYDTTAVRDQTQKSEFLAESKVVETALDLANQVGELTGLTKAKNALGEIRNGLNESYLAFRLPEKADTAPGIEDVEDTSQAAPDTNIPVKEAEGLQHRMVRPKQRVLIVGASSIQFAIGTALEKEIPKYEGVKARRFGKLASGLSRPDFFDWPAQIRKLLKEFKPDLMIANFGGNGAQGIPLGKRKSAKFKTPEWDEAYTKRVHQIIDMAHDAGADVAFLGMPNMRSKKFANKMKYLNRVQKEAAESRGAVWVSSWDWTSDSKGKYRKSIKIGKKRGLMRTSDGIHYSKLGARFVVKNMLAQLEPKYAWAKPNEPVIRTHQFVRTSTSVVYAFREFSPKHDRTQAKKFLWLEPKGDAEGSENCYMPSEAELRQFVASTGVVVFLPVSCSMKFGQELTFEKARTLVIDGLKLSSDMNVARDVLVSAEKWTTIKRKFEPQTSPEVTEP